MSDLQSNITFKNGKVLGTSKYVTGYTGFSGDPALQEGNYLALHAASDAGATITAELIGGVDAPITLDADGILIARITGQTQAVKFTATKNGVTNTVTYRLASLVFEEET